MKKPIPPGSLIQTAVWLVLEQTVNLRDGDEGGGFRTETAGAEGNRDPAGGECKVEFGGREISLRPYQDAYIGNAGTTSGEH